MDKLNNIAQDFLATYGVIGVVLAGIILLLLVIQAIYYLGIYKRIPRYRLLAQRKVRDEKMPVSVVVPLFAEDADYIDFGLVPLLTQEYDSYEVVVVYVGNDDSFFADLKDKKRIYANLVPVYISCSPRYPVSSKTAINVGLKSAHNEYIILTTPDATPTTSQWLANMARGFNYGDVVLGYCGIAPQRGFKNAIFREWRFSSSVTWLSAAMGGHACGASRHNMGFTKELYFKVRGFNHLNMNVGEDDLFVQSIATRDNVSVVLTPRAVCRERTWGGWRWWLDRVHHDNVTHYYYPMRAKMRTRLELLSRAGLFAAVTASIILMPKMFWGVALLLLLVRHIVVMRTFLLTARRMGETSLIWIHGIYDLVEPLLRLCVRLSHSQKRLERWR